MNNYYTERNLKTIEKIRKYQKELPDCFSDFMLGIESNTSSLTRLGYCYDLSTFFTYLQNECPKFDGKKVVNFSYDDLNRLSDVDIEQYMSYLNGFVRENGKSYTNSAKTKSRKFASLRAMFKYFFKKSKINSNVCDKVSPPKVHEKEIIRLEVDEVANLLDMAENGDRLTKNQQAFHEHTEKRDI